MHEEIISDLILNLVLTLSPQTNHLKLFRKIITLLSFQPLEIHKLSQIQGLENTLLLIISHHHNQNTKSEVLQCQVKLQQLRKKKWLTSYPQILKFFQKLSMQQISNSIEYNECSLLDSTMHSSIESIRQQVDVYQVKKNENIILRDILYILLNVQAKFISTKNNTISFKQNINIENNKKRVILSICELGLLYKNISEFLFEKGQVGTAFVQAIKQQLVGYLQWISIIENLLNNGALTIRKLYQWSLQPLQRLKWLGILTQAIYQFSGSDIISIINSYKSQGDSRVKELINRIIFKIIKPLIIFVKNWMQRGSLVDVHKQFFIQVNGCVEQKNFWTEKYVFLHQKISNVIKIETGQKIFQTGKCLNFLKIFSHLEERQDFFQIKYQNLISSQLQYQFTLSPKFENWVIDLHQKTNHHLFQILFQKYFLKEHFKIIKKVLLMQQGDFIQQLMDRFQDQLNKPASFIFSSTLNSYLQSCIKSTNLAFFKKDILDKIYIKLQQNKKKGMLGWQIFSLSIDMQIPLNAIFNQDIMRVYEKIFNYLWQIKRQSFILCKIWVKQMKSRAYLDCLYEKLLFSTLLRNSMYNFIQTFQNYILLTIQQCWRVFMQKLQKSSSLQQLIRSHQTFLQNMLFKIFYTSQDKQLYDNLFDIISLVVNFEHQYNHVLNLVEEVVQKQRCRANQTKIQEFLGKNKQSKQLSKKFNVHFYLKKQMFAKIERTGKYFKQSIQRLNILLNENEKYKSLKFLVDFNEYYASLKSIRIIRESEMNYFN